MIFRALRSLLRTPIAHQTKEDFAIPFGLTQSEWNALKSLLSHEGWEAYLKALDAVIKLKGENLLQNSQSEALHFVRGTIVGLRTAGTLIELEKAKEDRVARERAELQRRSAERERDVSVLFGSPGWRPQRKSGAERA